MQVQRTRFGYAVRLETGEEVMESFCALAAREGIRAAFVSGIGKISDPELGWFAASSRTYQRREFPGDWELIALSGNLSELDGQPFAHLHATLGGEDYRSVSGHLFRGVTSVTCEAMVLTDPGVFHRLPGPPGGLNPLDLG